MQHVARDSARWALAGLATGIMLSVFIGLAMGLPWSPAMILTLLFGFVGACLGPLSLIVVRAAQTAGVSILLSAAFWGGAWGLALGMLYWWFYDNSFPVWQVVLPMVILAAASLINMAVDVNSRASFVPRRFRPGSSR